MTRDQLTGPLRSLLPFLTLVLVRWFDDETAGLLAGAIVLLGSAAWSWYTNRPAALVTEAAKTNDVTISVGYGAPAQVKKVMRDPAVLNVVAKAPPGAL